MINTKLLLSGTVIKHWGLKWSYWFLLLFRTSKVTLRILECIKGILHCSLAYTRLLQRRLPLSDWSPALDQLFHWQCCKSKGVFSSSHVQAVWTEDHALAWQLEEYFRQNSSAWALDKCLAWDKLEENLPFFIRELIDCPCTLAQARADTGRFHVSVAKAKAGHHPYHFTGRFMFISPWWGIRVHSRCCLLEPKGWLIH